ncbi:MAG: MMPL family transporter, partial [Bdellovibrionales bacterium]|nr:MMPL family transporter [Bdellovibrionales bacterium]
MMNDARTFTISKKRVMFLAIAATLVGVGLTIASLFHLASLETRYSMTEFLATDDVSLREDAEIKKRYRISDAPWIVVVAERNTGWMNKAAISALSKTAAALQEQNGIKNVSSLGTLETVVKSKSEVRLGRLTEVLEKNEWNRLGSQDGVVAPVLVSKDHLWATMLVEVDPAFATTPEALLGIKNSIETTVSKELGQDRLHIGGISVIQAELSQVLSRELILLGGFGAFAATLALMFLFQGYSAIVIAVLTCVSSIVVVLGTMASFGKSLGVLSISLPILIAVQTLSLTVHCLFAFIEDRKNLSKIDALISSFRRLLLPNLLVSLATGAGFLTLAFSHVSAMRDFGTTVAAASLALWFITTLLLYPLLLVMKEPTLHPWVGGKARWTLWIMKHRLFVLASIGFVSFAAAASGLQVNYSHRLFDELSPDNQSILAADIVDRSLGGVVPVEIEVRLADK